MIIASKRGHTIQYFLNLIYSRNFYLQKKTWLVFTKYILETVVFWNQTLGLETRCLDFQCSPGLFFLLDEMELITLSVKHSRSLLGQPSLHKHTARQ